VFFDLACFSRTKYFSSYYFIRKATLPQQEYQDDEEVYWCSACSMQKNYSNTWSIETQLDALFQLVAMIQCQMDYIDKVDEY
jgi:hypothetical protein